MRVVRGAAGARMVSLAAALALASDLAATDGPAQFPAPGLRRPLVTWQRRMVARILQAGAAGVSADTDAWRRQPGAMRFVAFLRRRGVVLLTEDRRVIVADRRGLAEFLAAGDEG